MKIKSITRRQYVGPVYNIHCTPDESYYVEGVLVHNCYKGNTDGEPVNMSLSTFMKVLDKYPPTLTQVALGITGTQTNPDFVGILEYCRSKGIIPNYTLTGIDLTQEIVDATLNYCGAVAVSAYPNQLDTCYDTVKWMTDAGMTQVNIHCLYHADNLDFVRGVLEDTMTDPRLEKLNATVLLALKQKGKASENGMRPASQDEFNALVDFAMERDIKVGMDSCSGPKFLGWCDTNDCRSKFEMCVEPCESGLFSSYINVYGDFFPCSFMEGEPGWEEGLSVVQADDFVKDIWFHQRTVEWRQRLLVNKRHCPRFAV